MSTNTEPDETHLLRVPRASLDIYGGEGSKLAKLLKAQKPEAQQPTKTTKVQKAAPGLRDKSSSNLDTTFGIRLPLIDKFAARELRDFNSTHAICLDAKQASSLGLGHRDQSIHDVLDPLCSFSWQDTLDALAIDYWETGDCFLEIVYDRDDPKLVTGLYHMESAATQVETEEERTELFHYVVSGEAGQSRDVVMARFGDLADLRSRDVVTLSGDIVNSEIAHVRQSTNRSRHYGYPDYMSAVPSIELVQCMTQHEFDFYFNRGVPEFMMFLIGKDIGGCWDKVEKAIRAGQGLGQSHKTLAAHIPGDAKETRIQIEKLAMEDSGNSGFPEKSLTLDMRIATAHGMPPQLANIATPGKIGAANEGPNAMLTFQMRKLGQAQRLFSRAFAATLGKLLFNQPEGKPVKIEAKRFLGDAIGAVDAAGMPLFNQDGNGFNTILDGMTLGARDTMSSMKEPLAGSDRNPEDGKLSGSRDRKKTDTKRRSD